MAIKKTSKKPIRETISQIVPNSNPVFSENAIKNAMLWWDVTNIIEEAMEDIVIPRWENVESERVGETLSLRQEKFCRLYALDTEFMGNWVQAYLEVYDIDTEKKGWYKTACVCASQLLSNPKVFNRINDLLATDGLNDQFVDKQLLYVISQQADLWNKMNAVKEYNKLKKRITDKIEMEGNFTVGSITIK